jgi:hypothetical protein
MGRFLIITPYNFLFLSYGPNRKEMTGAYSMYLVKRGAYRVFG